MALAPGNETAARSRILCYHSTGTPLWGVNDVSPARFRRHLELALAGGYRFVPAADIAAGRYGDRDLAITFDDGLASVALHAAPILAELGIPWTIFVVSDWAEGKAPLWPEGTLLGWREIEHLAAAGAQIGSHSVTHGNFGLMSEDQAREELAGSRRVIASRLGIVTNSFAIPMGQAADWTPAAAAAARDVGYEYVYAQAEETRPPDTIARTFITRWDGDRVFRAALGGRFDRWEEWR
jgi:peptidoglycan/xylan/chitin deacetylase (PgdA/CDA1 family)